MQFFCIAVLKVEAIVDCWIFGSIFYSVDYFLCSLIDYKCVASIKLKVGFDYFDLY